MRPPSLLAAALLLSLGCAPARAAPPVWHVHGSGPGEVTLFGSVHILSDATTWKTAALAADLARADRVWFEIPLDDAATAAGAATILARGRLPEGETLQPLLSDAGRIRLARVADKLGLPLAALDHMRPWLAEVLVSVTYFQKTGGKAELGVERQITADAPPASAKGAFETADDQVSALAGGTVEDQIKALEETLKEIETDPDNFARLAAAWARGDVKTIEVEGLDDLKREAPGAYQRLVVARNRNWLPEVEALLKQPGRTFAVVGVGHLVGPDGLPALLRRDGLKVDGP